MSSEKQIEHHKELSELRFLDFLKERCKNSYQVIRKAPIYFADPRLEADFYLMTPEAREIRTAFWLDRIVKDMHSWKRFPSRSKYLKGYTTLERAGHPSSVYVMVPYDGSRIGICPHSSFYKSFNLAQKDFGVTRLDNDGLISWLMKATSGLKTIDDKLKFDGEPETTAQFNRILKQIDDSVKGRIAELKKKAKENETLKDEERSVLADIFGRYITSIDNYIEEKLDPENNGFSCVRVESFSKHPDAREVWVDQPCLLVKRSAYLEMYKRGAVK